MGIRMMSIVMSVILKNDSMLTVMMIRHTA